MKQAGILTFKCSASVGPTPNAQSQIGEVPTDFENLQSVQKGLQGNSVEGFHIPQLSNDESNMSSNQFRVPSSLKALVDPHSGFMSDIQNSKPQCESIVIHKSDVSLKNAETDFKILGHTIYAEEAANVHSPISNGVALDESLELELDPWFEEFISLPADMLESLVDGIIDHNMDCEEICLPEYGSTAMVDASIKDPMISGVGNDDLSLGFVTDVALNEDK